MKKNKVVIIILVVLAVISILLICFFVGKMIASKSVSKINETDEKENMVNKPDNSQEAENNENQLENIVISSKIGSELTNKVSFANIYSESIYEQILSGKVTDEYKIMMAINKVLGDVSYSYMLETPENYMGNNISSENLESVVKEIFGEDTKVNHKPVYLTNYDYNTNYYTITPMGFAGGDFNYIMQVPYKIEENSTECYLYAYEIFTFRQTIGDDIVPEIKTDIFYDNKKSDYIMSVEDENINNEEYQQDIINSLIESGKIDKTKLVKIKYTLKKVNKSYYINGVEKI